MLDTNANKDERKVQLTLPAELHQRLKTVAAAQDKSLSELLAELIDANLPKIPAKITEAGKDAA